MVLDKEKRGDQVVENKTGEKVMLIGSDLASEIEGLVVDYQKTPQGAGFTISTPSPVA
jgi:Fe-S cluster assembly iron-binding protein IscA